MKHYRLIEVKVNNETLQAQDGKYTFAMPAENVTIDATYSQLFDTSVTSEHGTVLIDGDKTEAIANENVSFTITPEENYRIESVSINNGSVEYTQDENTYSFTMPAGDVSIVVTYIQQFEVILQSDMENADLSGADTYDIGSEVTITASIYVEDQDGNQYRFIGWQHNEEFIPAEEGGIYEFILSANTAGSYTAVYEREYNVNIASESIDDISANITKALLGEEVILQVNTDSKITEETVSTFLKVYYKLENSQEEIEIVATDGKYSFLMPQENICIYMQYETKQILDYGITNDLIYSYTGNDSEIVVPSSYSRVKVVDEPIIYYENINDLPQSVSWDEPLTGGYFQVKQAGDEDWGAPVINGREWISYVSADMFPLSIKLPSSYTITVEDAQRLGDDLGTVLASLFNQTAYDYVYSFKYKANNGIEGFVNTGNIEDEFDKLNSLDIFPITFYDIDRYDSYLYVEGDDYAIREIQTDAFRDNANITKVEFAEGIETIGRNAFLGCSLKEVILPSSIININDYAFPSDKIYYNGTLETFVAINSTSSILSGRELYIDGQLVEEIEINNDFTDIFSGYEYLKKVTIGNNVTAIPDSAFSGCSNITEIHYQGTMDQWLNMTFGSSWLSGNNTNLYINNELVDEITINADIPSYAFDGIDSITKVTLGEGVTSIGNYAFDGCSALQSIELPSSVISIGNSAFYGCYALALVINNSTLSITAGNSNNGYVGYYAAKIINSGDSQTGRIETIDNVKYYIDDATGEFVAIAPINKELTSVTIVEGTKKINQYAFDKCINLTEVILPSTLQTIGNSAFSSCTALALVINNSASLTITKGGTDNGYVGYYAKEVVNRGEVQGKIEIIDNVQYYINDTTDEFISLAPAISRNAITSISLADGTTEISQYAFSDCSNLTEINLPSSLTSIGRYAFYVCSSLTTISLPANLQTIGYFAFYNCRSLATVTFAEGSQLKSIGEDAFSGCSALQSIELPSSVTSIGDSTFYYCSSLTEINLPSSLTSIGRYAFCYCSSLTSITLPESLQTIGNSAFYGCTALATVINHSSLTITMGSSGNGYVAYYAEEVIEDDVTIEGRIEVIDNVQYLINDSTGEFRAEKLIDKSVTSVTIVEGANALGENIFKNCNNLTEITLPSTITSLDFVFGVTSLYKISLPSTLTSICDRAFYSCENLAIVNFQGTIDQWVGIEFGYNWTNGRIALYINDIPANEVTINTDINAYAFYSIKSITSVTLGENVTIIGNSAFAECGRLQTVTFAQNSQLTTIGNGAFSDCVLLNGFVIPSGVESIGSSAFSGCKYLTEIEIPESVLTIGSHAFQNCSNLMTLTLPATLPTISSNAFSGAFEQVLADSAAKIYYQGDLNQWLNIDYNQKSWLSLNFNIDLYINGELMDEITITTDMKDYAFYGIDSITKVVIGEGVTTINAYAFSGCTNLTSVTISTSVISIGNYAFQNCDNLKNLTFVEGSQLQNIGDYSFQNCDSLTSITLPASLQTIGNYAFQNCYALALVINNSTILTIKNGGIDNGYVGCYAQEVVNSGETAQGRIEIIENMQYYVNEKTGDFIALAPSIPKSEVTTIELDSRTTSLCQYLFNGCETLTSIIIPEGVKSIGIYAFKDCSGLTFITIPSTVESIGYYAFTRCSNLTDVTINSEYAYNHAIISYRIYLLQYADIVRVKAELVGDDIINDSHSYLNSSNFNRIQLSEDGQYYIYTNI